MVRRIRSIAALCVSLSALAWAPTDAHSAEAETVAIRFVGDPTSAAARGARLGVDEATRTARYFGFAFVLEPQSADAAIAVSAQRDAEALAALAGKDRLVLNALDPARGPCLEGLFHVAPSAAMTSAALEQWRARGGAESVRVEAWHPSLVKFAARDLNKRYREQYDEPMGSEAWAGWAAARSIGEAVVRTRSTEPAALAAYFRGDFGFDGQKGSALTFHPNGQLRQPLYVVNSADEVVGETPLDLEAAGIGRCSDGGR